MSIINKITELRDATGLRQDNIQSHFDELNADGWYLIAVDNLSGWYRFFWGKVV